MSAPSDEFAGRLEKIEAMRVRGEDPYPVRFDRTHTFAELRARWDDKLDSGATSDDTVRVAGRVLLLREQGKLVFATVRDGTDTGQLFVSKADLGDDEFARFGEEIERGDWIGVEGAPLKTRRGELSVKVTSPRRYDRCPRSGTD
jgi:lysyl-tRNA synthetase, class II